jgi:SAM-dependent methyltransferase
MSSTVTPGQQKQREVDPMSAPDETIPEALRRALPLMANPPKTPDVTHGYLDLLGEQRAGESPGPIQSLWNSTIGSGLYHTVQAVLRKVLLTTNLPESVLRLEPGSQVLDVGCGPGNLTTKVGNIVGSSGLALGLDVSAPMLRRAVEAGPPPQVGFLRGDARELPFHDDTFDAVISLLALQLIPEPLTTLRGMIRTLSPGAPLAVLVPSAANTVMHWISGVSGNPGGIEFFDPDEVSEFLLDQNIRSVHTRQNGTFLWILGRKQR